MLTPPPGLKVLVATKPIDFRNYVERVIMRSPVLTFSIVRVLSTV
jgi:hypothetical protein